MPDPLLYLKAISVAAIASLICWSAISVACRSRDAGWQNVAGALAMGCGLAGGFYVFHGGLTWPPFNALERFLAILLPAVLLIELSAGLRVLPIRLVWLLRMLLAFAIPCVLLHGSVYMDEDGHGWKLICIGGACVACLWGMLARLVQRSENSPVPSIPFALHLATLVAGLCVMMAGYIKGGASAFPLTASLIATTIAVAWMTRPSAREAMEVGEPEKGQQAPGEEVHAARVANAHLENPFIPILGVSVVGFASLLMIGYFFGELSTRQTLIIFGAPLLAWVTELPWLRLRNRWLAEALRLFVVLLPLAAVLVLAKRDFDRDMAPLLVRRGLEQRSCHARSALACSTIQPAFNPRFDGVNLR